MSAHQPEGRRHLLAGLALLALVAWQSAAKAVHYASDPTHEPCPALTPGDHALTIDTAQGRRQVVLHAPRDAYKPRPLVIALHGAGQTAWSSPTARASAGWPTARTSSWPPRPRGDAGTPGTPGRSTRSRPPPASTPPASSSPAYRMAADRRRGWRAISPGASRAWHVGRGLPGAAAVHARAPAAVARDARHRRSGLPLRRPAARLPGQRAAVAAAVAAHRRLPRQR